MAKSKGVTFRQTQPPNTKLQTANSRAIESNKKGDEKEINNKGDGVD